MTRKKSTIVTLTPFPIGGNRVCIIQLRLRSPSNLVAADASIISARLLGNPMVETTKYLANMKRLRLTRPLEVCGAVHILGQTIRLPVDKDLTRPTAKPNRKARR